MKHRRQLFRLIITLIILWLLLSGMFKPLLLVCGVISIIIVCYLSVNMKVLVHRGQPVCFRVGHVISYCCWLMVEILKSNIYVIKYIFNPALPIDPLLKNIPSQQKTELGRVIYANSITLTPGTVAINIAANGNILVHALNRESLTELEDGEMGNKVCQLEPVTESSLRKQN